MHADMNLYDGEHAVSNHPKMSKEEWEAGLPRRLEDVLHARAHGDDPAARRRHATAACRGWSSFIYLFALLGSDRERPPAAGRLAAPEVSAATAVPACRSSRSGRSIRSSLRSSSSKYARAAAAAALARTGPRGASERIPNRYAYTDQAMTPVTDDETETLDLFTHSDAARKAVEHAHKVAQLTGAQQRARAAITLAEAERPAV